MPLSIQLKVLSRINEVDEAAWDALGGARLTPFTRWAWLDALEFAGCVTDGTGWQPRHLTLWDGARLVAAAPAYLKSDSDGDFSRDWGWADAAHRARIAYYPKLLIAVPFTPVTGTRLLTATDRTDAERDELRRGLIAGALELARAEATSLHVLFPDPDEALLCGELGLGRRIAFQYHWKNEGYASMEEFLQRFNSKKRNQVNRERGEAAKQGITLRTVRGAELAQDSARWGKAAYELHRHTIDQMAWGRRWLNRAFYDRVFARMPGPLEVVAAEIDGRLVAGAFNVATDTHLYGRYWGCFEQHRFLHFNVCLYHSIDDCIRRGLLAMEGGAGGEHKIPRGFVPSETYSNHWFVDPRLQAPLQHYIASEADERQQALERWRQESPLFKKTDVSG